MSVIKKDEYFMDNREAETDVADLIAEKSYVPKQEDLPQTAVTKNIGMMLITSEY